MAERNAWVIERTDLGILMVEHFDCLRSFRTTPQARHVVRYDFIPTQFPECKPLVVRFEHDPSATPERVEFDECMALGKAIRGMFTADRTGSKPSSAGSSEPPPTA